MVIIYIAKPWRTPPFMHH